MIFALFAVVIILITLVVKKGVTFFVLLFCVPFVCVHVCLLITEPNAGSKTALEIMVIVKDIPSHKGKCIFVVQCT